MISTMITLKSAQNKVQASKEKTKKLSQQKRPFTELDPNVPLERPNRDVKKHTKKEKVQLSVAQKQTQKKSSSFLEVKKFLKKNRPELYKLLCSGKLLLDFVEDEMLYKREM